MATEASKFSFTKTKLEALKPDPDKRYEVHDSEVRGLRLRVTSTGAKTFCLYRRSKGGGLPERYTIGPFPIITVEHARKEAMAASAAMAGGASPATARRTLKAEPIFSDAFEDQFLIGKRKRDGSALSEKTVKDYKVVVTLHLRSISKKKLSAITRADVEAVRNTLTRQSPAQADKAIRVISSVFNYLIDCGTFRGENPASRVKTNPPVERERFVVAEEMPSLMQSVEENCSPVMGDFFLLALATGARRENVASMRWVDVDLESAVWRIPRTKGGRPQVVVLSKIAVKLLERRRSAVLSEIPWVFPSERSKSGHMVEPSKSWNKARIAAGIPDVRIHDLRRTFASWQLEAGADLTKIGMSLNHKSLASTRLYARAALPSLRPSIDAATEMIWSAGNRSALLNPQEQKEEHTAQ